MTKRKREYEASSSGKHKKGKFETSDDSSDSAENFSDISVEEFTDSEVEENGSIEAGDPPVDLRVPKKKRVKTSKYAAVHFEQLRNKWVASVYHQGRQYYAGSYSSELDAAHAVNRECDRLLITRKNPSIGDPPVDLPTGGKKAERTSKYTGVQWKKQIQKWVANVGHQKRTNYAGVYASELDAAHAVNRECDRLLIPRKNPGIGDPPVDLPEKRSKKVEKTSKYKGVYWDKGKKKWSSSLQHQGKLSYTGSYSSELDAAHAVNRKCDRLLMPRKNPEIGDPPVDLPERRRKKKGRKSKYTGVYWCYKSHKWVASVSHQGKHIYTGTYSSELDAAHAVNRECDRLLIARKNPEIGDPPVDLPTGKKKVEITSKYIGVYWNKGKKKWSSSLRHQTRTYYTGAYSSELDAAHAVNRECDRLLIPRKNPDIGDPPVDLPEKRKNTTINKKQSMSKYIGVYWDKKNWRACVWHQYKTHYAGNYSSELDAAHAVNRECDRLLITRKNKGIGDPPADLPTGRKKKSPERRSEYKGVSWSQRVGKWHAMVYHNKKNYSCKCWEAEEEAAIAVNEKCIELGIPVKNPEITVFTTKSEDETCDWKKKQRKSKYTGVYCRKGQHQWSASIKHQGRQYYAGTYSSKIEAAHAVNRECDRLLIARKNPEIGDPPVDLPNKRKKRGSTSKYTGVSWRNKDHKWAATVSYQGKRYHIGLYSSEMDAAHAVNRECDRLLIARKNPEIGDPPVVLPTERKKKPSGRRSEYKGVSWSKGNAKWHATVSHNKKTYSCKVWEVEEEAAIAVNEKCMELGIPVKNPELTALARKSEDAPFDWKEQKEVSVIVKQENVSKDSVAPILSFMVKELQYAQETNEEFADTHFAYGNVGLKQIQHIVNKAMQLASCSDSTLNDLNEKLQKMKLTVMRLSSDIQAAVGRGVKREELTLPQKHTVPEVEITEENIFNTVQPFEGYLATKKAVKMLNTYRSEKKELIANFCSVFSHIDEYSQRETAISIAKKRTAILIEEVLRAAPREFKTGVCVKESTVCQGLGLFSTRFLPVGAVIGLFTGKLMTQEEALHYYGPGTRNRDRAMYICKLLLPFGREFLVIDPHELSSRVNHAGILGDGAPTTTENLSWVPIISNGFPYIAEVVIRPIHEGQEILTNYGDGYRRNPFLDIQPSALINRAKKIYYKSRHIDLT